VGNTDCPCQGATIPLTLHFEVDSHGDIIKLGVDGIRAVNHQCVLVLLQTRTQLQVAFRRGDETAFKGKKGRG
jgi:hypothetical protein